MLLYNHLTNLGCGTSDPNTVDKRLV